MHSINMSKKHGYYMNSLFHFKIILDTVRKPKDKKKLTTIEILCSKDVHFFLTHPYRPVT